MADVERAKQIAGIIATQCTEKMLAWGEAANEAERDPRNEAKTLLARAYGMEALKLAMAIAEKLKPGGHGG
jgi:hypothetical protein